jgi:hypothetical protein
LSKKDVYIEIGTIHRRYCDLNRSKVCAFEDLRVKHFYDKYHNSILTKINEMHSNIKKKGGFSFHFDIHANYLLEQITRIVLPNYWNVILMHCSIRIRMD